jgi:L-threonylcarbamoyladenylate synthase
MVESSTRLQLRERDDLIRVSGALEKHYSPEAKVFTEGDVEVGDGFLALADIPTPAGVIRLASPNSVEEFARILYQSLRDADAKGLTRVKVINPLGPGLAAAIRDRVARASR